MAYRIEIGVEGMEQVQQILRNYDRYLPSKLANRMRKTSNNIVKDLHRNMENSFSHSRGNLVARTKSKKMGFLRYDITMPKYGNYVNSGTRPHKVSKPYLFKPWERATGARSLSTAIYKQGTEGRFFIDRTMSRDYPKRMKQFSNEFLAELDKIARGGV